MVIAVGAACQTCGTALRENARFCDECGSATAVSSDTAEYKQVTVLFADVVRSTDIAAALEMERLREIMTDLVERSAAVVQRYGGTVEYNGDGVMALFGAPVALEHHAFRGCLAALAIQDEAGRLAADVQRRDGVPLRVRVGLNSGRVIAGQLGSGSLGYAATGEAVGFAQRMESAAPPGGVMLSESTARLVEQTVQLAEPEWAHIKGSEEPVRVRRLVAIGPLDGQVRRAEAQLVGRRWEMAALDALLDRAIGGRGGVVNVVGPAGIGKSRVAREVAAVAAARGVEVCWAFCESHASDVPFYAVMRLLRAGMGVADVDGGAARDQIRRHVTGADPDDVLLFDDLLGVADPEVPLPQIAPDARRRRLTALINSVSLARSQPALFVIEDAHWIDAVSEAMLADLLTVIPRTPSMVLITARPEYEGALTRAHGAQTIALAPLGDSDTAALLGELLGPDPSVGELTAIVADRAHGNPFFAEEIVRELAQRGVLAGGYGHYSCDTNASDVAVPATVQAAIEARIDRLSTSAKRTLCAASVIGARFSADLLAALGIAPEVDELLGAELIDQVQFTPSAEFAFRHPLIRAVAYESQLKSDRAQWHRRLATAIQDREPASVEENAALIAEHLSAAGELRAAYGWHMRAAAWSTNGDFTAARLSWDRSRRIADQLPGDDPDQLAMRIAPRTMLCATDFHAIRQSGGNFEELRELCDAAGDKVSLAIGMTGLATELLYSGRSREGSRLATEQMVLLESIGDPTLTVGLSFVAFVNWFDAGDFDELIRWADTVIDLADGDPTTGADFGMGSPLGAAMALRGCARWWLGRPGWRQDLQDALAMARDIDPATRALLLAWTHGLEICYGVLRADDSTLQMIEEAVQTAEASSNDFGLGMAEYMLGVVLLHRDNAADRYRGLTMMAPAQDMWRDRGPHLLAVTQLAAGREKVRRGDRKAVQVMRDAADSLHQAGRHPFGTWGTGVFVESLLMAGGPEDLTEAEGLIDRLASQQADRPSAMLEITVMRLRTLSAAAHGDDVGYQDLVGRYRTMAEALGFDGHIDWAKAMAEGQH